MGVMNVRWLSRNFSFNNLRVGIIFSLIGVIINNMKKAEDMKPPYISAPKTKH